MNVDSINYLMKSIGKFSRKQKKALELFVIAWKVIRINCPHDSVRRWQKPGINANNDSQ